MFSNPDNTKCLYNVTTKQANITDALWYKMDLYLFTWFFFLSVSLPVAVCTKRREAIQAKKTERVSNTARGHWLHHSVLRWKLCTRNVRKATALRNENWGWQDDSYFNQESFSRQHIPALQIKGTQSRHVWEYITSSKKDHPLSVCTWIISIPDKTLLKNENHVDLVSEQSHVVQQTTLGLCVYIHTGGTGYKIQVLVRGNTGLDIYSSAKPTKNINKFGITSPLNHFASSWN